MITKKTTYIIKVNPEISLIAKDIPSLLNKIEADIKFWEGCLIGNKDKKFCKNIEKLIKEYKKAFTQTFNYKG